MSGNPQAKCILQSGLWMQMYAAFCEKKYIYQLISDDENTVLSRGPDTDPKSIIMHFYYVASAE